MTGQEKWKVIDEVCDEIRASLQREADHLKKQAEDCGDKDSIKKLSLEIEATAYVKAQINVTSVKTRLQMNLIQQIIEETK